MEKHLNTIKLQLFVLNTFNDLRFSIVDEKIKITTIDIFTFSFFQILINYCNENNLMFFSDGNKVIIF